MTELKKYIFGERLDNSEEDEDKNYIMELDKGKIKKLFMHFYGIELDFIRQENTSIPLEEIYFHLSKLPTFTIYTFDKKDLPSNTKSSYIKCLSEETFNKLQDENKIIEKEEGNLIELNILSKKKYLSILNDIYSSHVFYDDNHEVNTIGDAINFYIPLLELQHKLFGGEGISEFIKIFKNNKNIFNLEDIE